MSWINNSLFLEKVPEKLHPLSYEYTEYWREQKRRCIEGYWVGGKWMPGNLYFYVNFGTILLNKSRHSKTKQRGRPLLMDIFWETAYYWMEARGLTGFSEDPTVQFYKKSLQDPDSLEKLDEYRTHIKPIREQLFHSTKNIGKPQFLDEAKNLMWLANRGPGKSYFAADAVIAHEWLFDGAKEYLPDSPPLTTEVLVGAGDAKYSSDLLAKVKLCLEGLPGGTTVNGIFYPPPFSKRYSGGWGPGDEIIHSYKRKQGGSWTYSGTKSTIKHRTYKDNPFAAQGTRPAVAVKEEIGMFDNLIASHEADVETQKSNGTYKFGSTLFMGTGGDMDGGTVDASKMFYDPETYDCLSFEDTWEHKGKISYFLPATHGKLNYKDENGNTRYELAIKEEERVREKLRKGKNATTALDAYIQYNPIKPSEMFLTKSGNIFPKKELSEWLAVLENNDKYRNAEFIGDLIMDELGDVRFVPDLNNSLNPIRTFPIDTKREDIEGAITIWEHPFKDESGQVPYGLYVAGTDPYDHDESGTPSLGSTFIYKRYFTNDAWYETPVAEYTGRPKADEYYKRVILLLLYYNARCLYENMVKGFHQYAQMKNYDWLLMEQPGYIKDMIPNSTVDRVKGMHMQIGLKTHGEVLIKNWLEAEYAPGRFNLQKIRSVPLLKELISYNRQGNFDRVIAFMMCMYAVQERERMIISHAAHNKPIHQSDFFNRPMFSKSNSFTQFEQFEQFLRK